jgi:transposase
MGKTYRAYLPEQDFLLPPSLRDWLPEDHLAYFVSDVVEQLDLSAIESVYEEEGRGQPPYHPRMMSKILIYGYCVGVFSSRRMQKKLSEDVGFRVLAAENQPDFRTISDFRKQHLGALQGLFDQVLQIALQAGTMKLGRVVLDGSKVKANASKFKPTGYSTMAFNGERVGPHQFALAASQGMTLAELAGYDTHHRADLGRCIGYRCANPDHLELVPKRIHRGTQGDKGSLIRYQTKTVEEIVGVPENKRRPAEHQTLTGAGSRRRMLAGIPFLIRGGVMLGVEGVEEVATAA